MMDPEEHPDPYGQYSKLAREFALLRQRHRGHYSEEEGLLLEQMTDVWMRLSEEECASAKFLMARVPCAKRDAMRSGLQMDHTIMLPSSIRQRRAAG